MKDTNNQQKLPPLWTKDFILMSLANLFMAVAFYFLIPTLPLFVTDELHAEKKYIGIAMAVYTLAALIFRPFAGYSVDRYGRKWVYLISLSVFSLLFGTYLFAQTLTLLLIVRFFHGIFWSFTTSANSTAVIELIPVQRRGEGIGIFGMSMTVAMAFGPFLSLWIVENNSFHTLFLTSMILSVIGSMLSYGVNFAPYTPTKENKQFNLSKLFEKMAFPLAINMILLAVTYGSLMAYIAIYCKETKIPLNPGVFFLIFAISITLSRIFAGRVFDKEGPDRLVTGGFVLVILGFPMLGFIHNTYGFLASAIVLGFGNGVMLPAFQTMINNLVPPNRRGSANSTLFIAFDLGIGFGMFVFGFLSDLLGSPMAYVSMSGFVLLALLYYHSKVKGFYKENSLV